jgi:hypothetical protein
MKKIISVLTLIFTQFLFSQKEVRNYKWDEIPKFKEIPETFNSYPAVVLKDYRLLDNQADGLAFRSFVVKHQAVKILSEAGISEYNKVVIDKKYVRDYRDLKVRVIKPNGKIEELPKERIIEKEESDEKQFVFEGVESGDIVEYYYVIKNFPDLSGVEYFQREIPVMDAYFQINKTKNFRTYTAGYNGLVRENMNNVIAYKANNIPAYKSETNAANLANLAKVYYFSSANLSYDYKSFYWTLNNYAEGTNAKSMIKDFVTQQNLDDDQIPLDERLKRMDIYLKENLEIDNQAIYKKIFETKKISGLMVLNLYKDVLDYIKVPYQFVASTDKFDNHFDKENIIPDVLTEILIYIPQTKKYLSPFSFWMPYGLPNANCVNNDAVTYIFSNKKLDYHFIKINHISINDNSVKEESLITLDEDIENVFVTKKSTNTGYLAYSFRYLVKYLPEDKIREMVKTSEYADIDVDLKEYSFENKDYKYNYEEEHPFTIITKAHVKESWIENAGENYIITLGKVLGERANLYQETTRNYPIILSYPKKYNHSIKFSIPSGYAINSLDNLNSNKVIKNEAGEIIGQFLSQAKIEGNTLSIQLDNFYNFTYLEKEKYNEYRDLINSSYDFYNAAIVLSKLKK